MHLAICAARPAACVVLRSLPPIRLPGLGCVNALFTVQQSDLAFREARSLTFASWVLGETFNLSNYVSTVRAAEPEVYD